jgi:hypothetical protein
MRSNCVPLLALLALAGPLAAQAEGPRVALVHGSFGNYRHRDDYDAVMKQLGWRMDKFENKGFGQLAGRLGDYDLVLGTALFNYSLNVQDFSVYRDPLLAFLARGGAIVLTDTNYPDHVGWLARWGADWAVGLAPCSREGCANKWLDRAHPIFSSAAPITALAGTWTHMVPGAGWEVLSRCAEDGATSLFRTEGRGFMLLTSAWPHGETMLRNLWGTLQYTRAGVLPRLPEIAGFTYGDNRAAAVMRNLTDQPLSGTLRLDLAEPGGATRRLQAEATVPPGQSGQVAVSVPLTQRGKHRITRSLEVNGKEPLPPSTAEVTIPELMVVSLLEPKYRGAVMLAAPPRRVRAQVALHPFAEELTGASYVARLWQGGDLVSETSPRPVTGKAFTVSLPFRALSAQRTVLEVALVRGAGAAPLAAVRQEIPVIASRPNQVLIDEDLNTRVDGTRFFPVALYHVAAADFARVKALGFNTVQAWGTTPAIARANLAAAQAAGLKVILEGATFAANDGNLKALDPALRALSGHPALLAWYLCDEPSGEEKLAWCRRVHDYLAAKDPNHPVFMTSCSPGEFGRYVGVTDIFAVDPYPIPTAPVTMVSGWMQTAQLAARGRQPVWLIPQLHNWAAYDGHPENGRYPTPEEERNMVYQGLVWGAKGIFYYPWDDGPTGLTKDPKLMAAVEGINRELEALGRELLTCRHRVTARNSGALEGLYAAVYRNRRESYVIAVSVANEARQFAVPAGGLPPGTGEVMFEGRTVAVDGGAIRDGFAPLAVHVYRMTPGK